MGVLIFLTALVVEIILAVFCVISKSNQNQVRSIVRIGALTAFVLLAILGVIEWSLRYYALAGLLLVLAVNGAVSLFRKKGEQKAYNAGRVVIRASGMTALIFVVTLPAILFPQHTAIEPTGEFQVATVKFSYTDSNRIETYNDRGEHRTLNVQLWYPEDAEGTYPLIVFSHGGFGVKTSNETLYNELASHGYVVSSIDHPYHAFYTTGEDGSTTWIDMGYVRELNAEDARTNRQQSYALYQKWMEIRTGDIHFVIDRILAEADNLDADTDTVYRLVDAGKIGVMGHSLGGSAALGIGRVREDVQAVIALEAPFLTDIIGVEDGEFVFTEGEYPVPVLNVYSDGIWSLLGERPQYAKNYALLSDGTLTAFNVYISGVGHLSLTDLSLSSPLLTRLIDRQASTMSASDCLKLINRISLEFFDAYLKGIGQFTSDGMY
jgi:dienelactone hydrolase